MDLAKKDFGFEGCAAHLGSQKQLMGMRLDIGIGRNLALVAR